MKIWLYTTKEPLEYLKLDEEDEIKRSSINKAKKGDLILIYRGSPHSSIAHIFTAKTDPYEDKGYRDDWDTFINLTNKIQLNTPLKLQEMKKDTILGNWGIVRKNFMGSFFEVPNKEAQEIKKQILDKNPELTQEINELILNNHGDNKPNEITEANSRCINQNHRGRAHITRDICYLIHENNNINENSLSQLLIKNVGENNDYWKAYFQNCQKENCVTYNLDSARSLGLIECDKLILTAKGQELVSKLEDNEIFTHYYGIGTKQFFFKLALEDEVIKTAMDILKERERLRFWSPTCKRTKRVIEKYHQENEKFICDENKHPECVDCDHDALNHINQTSLVLETLKKTGKRSGFVFWFTSRVTPMHLTGQDPAYNGQNIYWDKNEVALIDGESENIRNPWVFSVNKYNFSVLTDDDITWNSALDVKKDDLILFYRGEPESAITDIFIAKTDPYDDAEIEEAIGGKAVDLHRITKISNTISWETLKNNPIIKEWVGVKMHFGKSHFKTSEEVWNELNRLILEKNPELKDLVDNRSKKIPKTFQIIIKLFNEFKTTYLPTPEGIEHTAKYDLERQKVQKYSEIIKNENTIYDVDDPPINHLLPIKEPSVAPAAVGDIRAFGHQNKDLPGLTVAIRDLITNLINNKSKDARKDFISTFKNSEYKNGFQTAMLTPTLYYLDPDFWFINKKTVATFNLISDLNGSNEKISGFLEEYIDNNEKVHDLVTKIKEYVPELDFETFDAFCHWMSSEDLGNYANDNEKFEDWLIEHEFKDFNIRYSLKTILKNYKSAKNNKLSAHEQERIKVILGTKFPDVLLNKSDQEYQVFSSAWGKWHYCPYVAVMNDKVTSSENDGFFINYMFREDMSGVYLSLRRGVGEIQQDDYLNKLKSQSEEYSQLMSDLDTTDFVQKIDLKGKKGSYPPFYEAATIHAKFYPINNLPDEEELESDFKKILDLYNSLVEKIIHVPESFHEYLRDKNYLYTPETIENFLLSLKIKPFVILTGNSGTGKTKIAQLFAEYLQLKNRGNHKIIPIGANWTENRHLLGFYNVITQDYQKTPSLDLLLKAKDDEKNPYLLILDEMNLSHVERYFADFLSAMESGKSIPLHSNKKDRELNVPEVLNISHNVLVVGTVNVDETTYMFSPKVLDRANTIEFVTYPAKDYILGEFLRENLNGDVEYLEDPISSIEIREKKVEYLKDKFNGTSIPEGDLWSYLAEEIYKFQETLREAGFDFGFRVIDEILRFIYVAWIYENKPEEWTNWRRYFDAQIMQKILPKIHGSQRELDVVLENLFKLCYNNESDNETWYLQELHDEYSLYPTSAKKLQWMGKTLQEKRFVAFTN